MDVTTLSDVRSHEVRTTAPSRRRRRSVVLAGSVAAFFLVAGALVVLRGGPSITIRPYHGAMPRFHVARAYHITYDVSVHRSPGYTEEVYVRRPFDSIDEEIARGAHAPYLKTVSRLGDQIFGSRTSQATLIHVPFAPARRDVRLDAVLPDALRTRRVRALGVADVNGRRCFVYRSASSLYGGPLVKFPSRSMHVDSYVDKRGLIVLEETYENGRLTTKRTARSIRLGSRAVASADFGMSATPVPPNKGGGAVRELTLDSRYPDGPFWDVPAAPSGFKHAGRYIVVPSQPQAYAEQSSIATNPSGLPGSLIATVTDVYVRGTDAVVIEQGSTVNDAKISAPTGGDDVDLGPVLGGGQLLLSASGSEVAAEPSDGTRFVRIVGTIPPGRLIALARSMTLQPKGTMTVLGAPR